MTHRILLLDNPPPQQPPPPPTINNNNILITVLVLSVAVILSASLYLLLRFFRRRPSTTTPHSLSTPQPQQQQQQQPQQPPFSRRKISPDPLIDTLPLFSFDSLSSTGDCAVCLSKFESKDLLRLLPICCHAFHADCIDTWLNSNQSCPLCRSPVFLPESELFSKLDIPVPNPNPARISSSTAGSRSFRVEIGNVSQRNNSGEVNPIHRSFSLGGNFEYILDDDVVSEVHSGSFRRTFSTEFKLDDQNHHQQQASLAAEVGTRGGGGGGGWLKDYLSHSLSSSLRSSGRWFFTGSSRREYIDGENNNNNNNNNNNRVSELDIETSHQLGDEISELFRWLSGV